MFQLCIRLLLLGFFLAPGFLHAAEEHASELVTEDGWQAYEGRAISMIRVHGLEFTAERALRALLGGKEGQPFSADAWLNGVHKLYNTTVIYDVRTHFAEPQGKSGPIELDLYLVDKYPILPNVNFQGGGGSQSMGLGVIDANVGGYFTNLSFQILEFNNDYSYDLNFFQEWLLDTDYVLGLDVSKVILPVDVQDVAGNVTQSFTWSRQQNQLLLGKRFGKNFRLYSFVEQLQDSGVGTFSGGQFRLHLQMILGRSNLTNFLEQGYELSVLPFISNPTDPSRCFANLHATFKRVWILPPRDNLAVFFAGGAMTPAPLPYQFHLGGYDSTRGFGTYRLLGRLYAYGTVEWRPYLFSFRTSFLGIDLIVLQGALFSDAGFIVGSAQTDGQGPLNSSLGLWSAGGGVRINFVRFPLAIVRLDYARTITPNEGWGFSFSLGQFF